MKKIEELNIEKLVENIFPYDKGLKVIESMFLKSGIAEWPTWFVVLYRGEILDDYLLLTICGHADYTRLRFLKDDFQLEAFRKSLIKAVEKNEIFQFYWFNELIGDESFMNLNEMSRLYSFLKIRHIELFEPKN